MWDAPNGTNQQLITGTIAPTNPAGVDTLYVDEAFQSFGAPDSLVILGSTDNGTTFPISLARWGNTQLATTTGNPSPYVPTATQWAKKKVVLAGNINKIQFLGKSGFGDN